MRRVKRRIFSGVVCEQEIYSIADNVTNIKKAEHKPRFETEDERLAHRISISRKKHLRLFNENFSPSSLYSTLTFDADNEVHDIRDGKKLRDLFFRRLRYAYPDAVIFLYIGRGKKTNRYHLHMVSEGVPEEVIRDKWDFGTIIDIEHLWDNVQYDKTDHGADYTGLANYLFDHWRPEFGGHRWKQSRNAKKPTVEPPKLIVREYSEQKPPKPPRGYILIESKITSYGYMHFKYIKDPNARRRKE